MKIRWDGWLVLAFVTAMAGVVHLLSMHMLP